MFLISIQINILALTLGAIKTRMVAVDPEYKVSRLFDDRTGSESIYFKK